MVKEGDEGEVESQPVVAIHRLKEEEAEVFSLESDGTVGSTFVPRDGKGLSGAGLGIEYFRTGHTFEVTDAEGNKRELTFPGFGEDFHTIQAEISESLRNDQKAQQVLGEVFADMLRDFSEKFAEPGSS